MAGSIGVLSLVYQVKETKGAPEALQVRRASLPASAAAFWYFAALSMIGLSVGKTRKGKGVSLKVRGGGLIKNGRERWL